MRLIRNFIKGIMNKDLDERLVENGQYIDALNIQTGEISGTNQTPNNIKGNTKLSSLAFIDGTPLSQDALTIGAYTDAQKSTIYWFVHDPNAPAQPLGKIDMIVSLNTITDVLTYHVISVYNPDAPTTTTLNFNPTYLINAVNLIDEMLFFTDDYNQPRYINITRSYPYPIGGVDNNLLDEMLNVVKKPPFSAPTLQLINSVGANKYLNNKFLCFAYRYRYDDNMYSATSQWSEPAFIPQQFLFNTSSVLNDGMTNSINDVILNINTGSSLVKGIDILFKEADGNIIKVSERIDKIKAGLPSNANYSYNFDEKVFTALPDSQLLRRYDNVPLKAKAQTIMGNRLMYGNYTEGYPLVSSDNQPVLLDYQANLNSAKINTSKFDSIPQETIWNSVAPPYPKSNLRIEFPINIIFNGFEAGSMISFKLSFTHFNFTGNTPFPNQETSNISINFDFIIPAGVVYPWDLASNVDFLNAIGTATTILPVYGLPPVKTSCEGITLTDRFCCAFPYQLQDKIKYDSYLNTSLGITKNIQVFYNTAINLIFPAIEYRNLQTGAFNYEYVTITSSEVFYRTKAQIKSLHSNRNYSVDMVYMDEYKRESTLLASINNLVNVPCVYSTNQNKIQVTIPTTQKAPYWAKSYKFVLKTSADRYETVYSNLYFINPISRETYYLLEGDNIDKVETGDVLVVKSDINGVNTQCSTITVLSKEAQAENFLTIPDFTTEGKNITVPGGVYMKVNQTNNTVVYDENAVITYGQLKTVSPAGVYPQVGYPIGKFNPITNSWEDVSIPAGSKIKLYFSFKRGGTTATNNGNLEYIIDQTLIASKSYNNFKEWWDGDSVAAVLNMGESITAPGLNAPTNKYNSAMASSPNITPLDTVNQYQFYRYGGNPPLPSPPIPFADALALIIRSGISSSNGANDSSLVVDIQIYRNNNTFIFETQPTEAIPIFYENNKCFGINSLGEHLGNIQNQNFSTNTPAIVDTEFFNCFAFGNGAESYKYNDSLIGRFFTLGNRSISESNQDFSQVRRFADMTYSGVLNEETNVNKLNEFNLGLLNFKPLEKSFGPIYVLDGRQNDVLVLQENRISYVLANKNLISDSAGGGAISSVPEILGTQIARIEEYGISNHPESYIQFGFDRFFVDSKRGAVLHLKGESYSADNLEIISDYGMKAYFRDNLTSNSNKQILGSYDPYLGNYVLGMNDRELPSVTGCLDCGIQNDYVLTNNQPITFCVDQQSIVGDVVVSWIPNIFTPPAFTISATYNSNNYSSGIVTSSGSFTIPKDVITENTVVITAVINDPPPISLPISISVSCVEPQELTVIDVVLTSSAEVGNTIHTESRYFAGAYTSPVRQESVLFASGVNNPLVSLYTSYTGNQGTGWFPTDGATVRMATRKLQSDSFDFDQVDDSFKYLRSNTLYSNNSLDISTLLSLATTVLPNQGGGNYNYAEFTNPSGGNYLYLIYDLRNYFSVPLCYSEIDEESVCCACYTCNVPCKTYFISNGAGVLSYTDCTTNEEVLMPVEAGKSYYVCATNDSLVYAYEGFFNIVEINACSCVPCNGDCIEFNIGISSPTAILHYSDCGGNITSVTLPAGVHNICMSNLIAPYITDGTGTIDFNNCICL